MKIKKYAFTEKHAYVKTTHYGYGFKVQTAFIDMQVRTGRDSGKWNDVKQYWNYEIVK